jgi:hypothetical protein
VTAGPSRKECKDGMKVDDCMVRRNERIEEIEKSRISTGEGGNSKPANLGKTMSISQYVLILAGYE